MSFLKKFGKRVLSGAKLATGLQLPIGAGSQRAGLVTGQSVDTLGQVVSVIGHVEVFGQELNIKGADKFKAARPVVRQILLTSLVGGRKFKNKNLFEDGSKNVTEGIVQILNSLD